MRPEALGKDEVRSIWMEMYREINDSIRHQRGMRFLFPPIDYLSVYCSLVLHPIVCALVVFALQPTCACVYDSLLRSSVYQSSAAVSCLPQYV